MLLNGLMWHFRDQSTPRLLYDFNILATYLLKIHINVAEIDIEILS